MLKAVMSALDVLCKKKEGKTCYPNSLLANQTHFFTALIFFDIVISDLTSRCFWPNYGENLKSYVSLKWLMGNLL